ncbi:phosphate ABC transporter substrate-binding protein PstS [Yimella sp. cx-51]|nr:phosphate ABC transporter substrate-binding protein PstS [Yimella sp. cx-51]MBC9955763.1 phosphate ABC transporter substrate-binding protein PstS [Yimella sp. cx-51]QTH39673.1 phosphate ABC transporter substrate-binding protein PstS [Yimella sp. cx-51]
MIAALALSACGSDNNSGGSSNNGSDASNSSQASGGSAGGGSEACDTTKLTAEGSTAQDNAIQQVISDYQANCSGASVTYNGTGSGAGIKQFIAKQVQFAGSDSALKTTEKDGKIEQKAADTACASPAWNLPMVTGPIAITYNLQGVDKLVLTPALMADIFNGKITKWNDAAIKAVNKDAKLPDTDIKPMFRSDESGTTENFTKYLAGSAKDKWTAEPGKKWTGKGEGKAKTAGVASAVKSTAGSIGYVEWGAAKDNKLSYAQIDNGAGAVELTGESAGKAVGAAKISGQGNDLKLKLDYATKEAGAYPILLVTYEIVCSKYPDAKVGSSVKAFLSYFASDDAQKSIEDIGYAPLPTEISTKVKAAIAAIK